MKKLVTILLLAVLAVWSSYGQTTKTAYTFAQSTSTYTPITGGTVVLSGAFDDQVSSAIPIGFPFRYMSTACTQLWVNNGWMKLGDASATSPGTTNSTYAPISSTSSTIVNVIVPFGDDMRGVVAENSEIRYEVLGTAPNRIFVMQWKNVGRYYSTSTNGLDGLFNFQIRLHETTDKIEIVYGTCTGTTITRDVQVGIKGASSSDYLNRMADGTTNTWANTLAGTANNSVIKATATSFPANGLTFTYAPQLPGGLATVTPANNATKVPCAPGMPNTPVLSWTPNLASGGFPTSYDVYISATSTMPGTPSASVAATSIDASALMPWALSTDYYWQVVPKNGTGSSTTTAVNKFTTFAGVGTLTGLVTNFIGVPIPNVVITATPAVGSPINTTTDAGGVYTINPIGVDTYTVTATNAAYNTNTITGVAITAGNTTTQNITMVQPTISVLPNPLNVVLRPGGAAPSKVTITNAGPGVLTWAGSFAYVGGGTNSWMSMPTTSGTVASNHNVDVPVYLTSAGLTVGTVKQANITFTSTNPVLPNVVVPVNLTIAGTPVEGIETFNAALTDQLQGTVGLSWTANPGTGFLYYILKRDGTQLYLGTDMTYTDQLPAYGVYNYEVYAVYADGNSISAFKTVEWSNPVLTYSPATVSATLWTGTSKIVNHTVGNTGLGSLHYEFKNPAVVVGGAAGPMPSGYCAAASSSSSYEQIRGIAFNTLVASGIAQGVTPGVAFGFVNTNPPTYTPNTTTRATYTDLTSQSTTVTTGATYLMEVALHFSGYASDKVMVWIDYNRNGVFEDNEKTLLTGDPVYIVWRGNITIPADAMGGATRMRVRLAYNNATAPACGTTSDGEVEDYTVNISSLFATNVNPASGIVAANTTQDIQTTFSATGAYAAAGTYTNTYQLVSNDINTPNVTRTFQMTVLIPSLLQGKVTNCAGGAPLAGVLVTAGNFSGMTDEDGNYSFQADPATYTVYFNKAGFQPKTVNNTVLGAGATVTLNQDMCEIAYQPACANADRDAGDTKTTVSWCAPKGQYELFYDDGSAEDYVAWAYAGNMFAVKFTPTTYPAKIIGGSFYVGNNVYPVGGNIFGTTFKAAVYSEVDGKPGALIGTEVTATVTPAALTGGWIYVTGLNANVASGNFFIVMTPQEDAPNCTPIGIDKTLLTYHKSYVRSVTTGGAWQVSPNQDLMIRAIAEGTITAKGSKGTEEPVMMRPAKVRGLLTSSEDVTPAGYENNDVQIRMFEGYAPDAVSKYRVSRIAVPDPNFATVGTATVLTSNYTQLTYEDGGATWAGLAQGWYSYSVEAVYPNGEVSPKVYTNVVPHKMEADVTVNVSLTTGGSPAGAEVTLTQLDYPYNSYPLPVPASGTVVFSKMLFGHYTLTATKVGFATFTYNFTLSGPKTIPVILEELRYKPRNFYVDKKTLIGTWDAPLIDVLSEDFEGATFPPAGWTESTEGTYGWRASTNGASGQYFTIPAHTKYAYTNDDEQGDGNNGCCDLLTTPKLDLTAAKSFKLNFQSYNPGSYGQLASVEISIDGGNSFETLEMITPSAAWTEVEIDLTPYSGEDGYNNVKLQFHSDDVGEWASGWAIDDVKIQAGSDGVLSYGLFIAETGQSEAEVGQTAKDVLTYQYSRKDIQYGKQYTASVAAMYSSGYSEHDYYTFKSGYLFPARDLAVSTNGTCSALLEWNAPNPELYTKSTPSAANLPVLVAAPAAEISTGTSVFVSLPPYKASAPKAGVLYDNGPFVNSPGTGAGGADESNNADGSWGIGAQQSAGNSVAEDFTITATAGWDIKKLTVYAYQTSSGIATSPITGVYFRIYNGNPSAGGTVIWGDLTTNRMTSTTFSNVYRVGSSTAPSGNTDRPIMTVIAEGLNVHLEAGTYWIEWCLSGSSSFSGPWLGSLEPPAGNAIQHTSTGWAPLSQTTTPAIGIPFVLEGDIASSAPENMIGYNIYRDDVKIAMADKEAKSYWDLNVPPGNRCYKITAVYDLTPYGMTGTDESVAEGPKCLDVTCGFDLPFAEEWATGVFTTNQWTTGGENWVIDGQAGNPAPAAKFKFDPIITGYNSSLESAWLNSSKINSTLSYKIWADYDYMLDDRVASGAEKMAVEIFNGTDWTKIKEYTSTGDKAWSSEHIDISSLAKNTVFKIRFRANGANTGDIVYWMVDNIKIYPEFAIPAPINLTANAEGTPKDDIRLRWSEEIPCTPASYILDDGTSDFTLYGDATISLLSGNEFAGTDKGVIRSVDVFFVDHPEGIVATDKVSVCIYNASRVLVASSPEFVPAIGWKTVTMPDVAYNGTFYVMVKYTNVKTLPVGIDNNGPNASKDYGWFSLDGGAFTKVSAQFAQIGKCNFNLRANVCKDGGKGEAPAVTLASGIPSSLPVQGLSVVQKTVDGGAFTSATVESNGEKAFKTYNIYRATGTAVGGPWSAFTYLASTTAKEYLDQNLADGCYKYYVTAVWDEGESKPSNEDAECVPNALPSFASSGISLYPNPATTVTYIQTEKAVRNVSVYNAVGALVYTKAITTSGTIEIPTQNFAAGAYSVKIVTNNGETFSSKFIVTK